MIAFLQNLQQYSTASRARREWFGWVAWLLGICGLAGLTGLLMMKQGPSTTTFAWIIFLIGIAVIFYRPHYGIYMVVFYTLIGDQYINWAFPFAKNFSSHESIFYINDSLIFSPLEVYIVLTFLAWLLHGLVRREMHFTRGPLFWQMSIFMFFVVAGLAYGLYKRGDLVVALWEVRPLMYMYAMFLLASNLFKRRENAVTLMWMVCLSIFILSLIGVKVFIFDLKGSLIGVSQITEHSAAIKMNSVFIFAIGLWFYKASLPRRLALLAAVPVILISYVATQRRAAFMTLGFAIIILAILLFLEHRRLFWLIAPPAALLAGVYIAVFWNTSGTLAIPVDALKSVIAPASATAEDQASNYYRILEARNLSFTLHQRPITGVGFGQKFYVIVSMPNISWFEWWQYLPHNSIIWIWLKTGVFGFIAMLYLVGSAIQQGAQLVQRAQRNEISAALLAMSLYLLMHFIYAYVDISWDAKSMVLVGSIMGIINHMPVLLAQTDLPRPKRWPWQPEALPETGLRDLPEGEGF